MDIEEDDRRHFSRELRYQEGVESEQGFHPETEINEVTAETPCGGFATYQQIKKFQLQCGHVDKFRNYCICNRTCCENCLCQVCQRGTCNECNVRDSDGRLLCITCNIKLNEMKLQESERNSWFSILRILGIIVE